MAQDFQFQPALPFPPGVIVTGMAGRAERRQSGMRIPGVMIEMSRRQPHRRDDAGTFGDDRCAMRNPAVFAAPARPLFALPGQLLPIVRIEPAIFHPSTSLPSPHRLAQRSLLQPTPRLRWGETVIEPQEVKEITGPPPGVTVPVRVSAAE